MAPAAIFILALVIYTGFTIPVGAMHPWFRWINYLDPVAYAFEALMINEVGVSGVNLVEDIWLTGCSSTIDAYLARSTFRRVLPTTACLQTRGFAPPRVLLLVQTLWMETHTWRSILTIMLLTYGGVFSFASLAAPCPSFHTLSHVTDVSNQNIGTLA